MCCVRHVFSVYILLRSENRTELYIVIFIHMSALLLLPDIDIFERFMRCAASVLVYVPLVHMYTLLHSRFVLNQSLPKSSLPNIFISLLFVDENVNRFSS